MPRRNGRQSGKPRHARGGSVNSIQRIAKELREAAKDGQGQEEEDKNRAGSAAKGSRPPYDN
jgi:hypothetical protein